MIEIKDIKYTKSVLKLNNRKDHFLSANIIEDNQSLPITIRLFERPALDDCEYVRLCIDWGVEVEDRTMCHPNGKFPNRELYYEKIQELLKPLSSIFRLYPDIFVIMSDAEKKAEEKFKDRIEKFLMEMNK